MPPIRTMPSVKPVKTERTHEENQERAYIAASRRSDRSLEARIESARRASDIHKKRTGRALRVTEQDVINEEMYEEEEADLPVQYRRLQAYMAMAQTSNVFDGRLNSYLLSTMATRNMANAGFMNPSMSSYQSTPFFPYTPPQNGQQMQPPQSMQSPSQMYQTMPQSPQQQGSPQQTMLRQQLQPLSSSEIKPQVAAASQQAGSSGQQGASPVSPMMSSPQISGHQKHPSAPGTPVAHNINQSPLHAGYMGSFADAKEMYSQQQMSPTNFSNYDQISRFSGGANLNLLSSTLPVEAQQMFGTSAFDPTSFQNPYLMNQSHGMIVPPNGIGYQYNPNPSPSKPRQDSQFSNGMNQTLSPVSYPTMENEEKAVSYASMDNERSSYLGNMGLDTGNTYTDEGGHGGISPDNSNDFIDFFDSDGGQNMA